MGRAERSRLRERDLSTVLGETRALGKDPAVARHKQGMRSRTVIPVLLMSAVSLIGVSLAGCQTTGDGDVAPMAPAVGGPMVSGETPGALPGEMAGDAKADRPVAPTGDRSIVRTAWLTLRVDDIDAGAAALARQARDIGGQLVGEDAGTNDSGPYATVTVQVPADRLDDFLADARSLGTVVSSSVSASDVTLQVTDIDARVTALRASVARLLALLDEATEVADIVAIEAELGTRQAELDGLVAQQRALDEMVAMSSVTVSFIPLAASAGAPAPGFLPGLESGWNALRSAAAWLTTSLGYALPFALLAALVLVPVVLVIRRRRARAGRAGE